MTAAVSTLPLWTAEEAAGATGGRLQGAEGWRASGVSIDSRSLERGDLFIALKGPNRDAHAYVAQALANGAAAALVSDRPDGLSADAPLLIVKDTMEALWALGRAGRERSSARIAAVTGSVGKTGTKEALKLCLSGQGETSASAASYNNHWGVPLSLARLPRAALYGVFEIGMNHPGELGPLSRLVRPDVAVITTIQPAHIGNFRNLMEIADAKAEIFEGMGPKGVAILNRDNGFFPNLAEKAEAAGVGRIVGFGRHPEATVRLLDCSLYATCSAVTARVGEEELEYCLAQPGEHWVMNSLAVLAACWALGADVGQAAASLARLQPLKGRGEMHKVEGPRGAYLVIDESYNANPASVRAAIANLGRAETTGEGRRIAVLGDMLELGPDAPQVHARLAEPLRAAGIDLVFTCGRDMAALNEALPPAQRGAHAPDSAALLPLVLAAVGPGDALMVKGSLGSRMAPIVAALLKPEAAPDNDATLPKAANGD